MSQVSFGVTLGSFGAGWVESPVLCAWAEEIEGLGFDVLWFRDHLLWHSPVLDPFTALAAFAARTSRLRLGTGVLLLPLRHPLLVAKAVASLDHFSAGRVLLGVGVGGEFAPEYQACGVPLHERGRRADEALVALKQLWTATPATFRGRYYCFEGVTMAPRPLQQPHPPIWVGGRSAAALRRAARLGNGWFAYFETPQSFADKLQRARAYRAASDRAGEAFAAGLVLYVCVAPTYEAARQQAVAYLSAEYRQPFAHLVDKYCALGPLPQCLATIERFIAAGAQHLSLIPTCAPPQVLAQLRQLAPALRQLAARHPQR